MKTLMTIHDSEQQTHKVYIGKRVSEHTVASKLADVAIATHFQLKSAS